MTPTRIAEWHFCIGGFSQREGELTGLQKLWLSLAPLRTSDVVVGLREWDADWETVADLIARCSTERPRIYVYAYSWGAGYGAIQLAHELQRHGLEIQRAVFADPIWHGPGLLTELLAFSTRLTIVVPPNVQEVWSTFQTQDRPRAHSLIPANASRTLIHTPIRCRRDHEWMDDAPEFHRLCLRVAGLED